MAKKKDLNQASFTAKPVPEMPDGYYSGDKPNPNLRSFVERHMLEHPYESATDSYAVPAFDRPIESTKATAIYNMHTYWSKKPHDAIRQYIQHYTQPGDLVLDPFCGSGSTALAALMEGRATIAIDRSPAATFISKNYCTPVDTHALKQAFDDLKIRVQAEIDWLYETRCDRCGGKATTSYTVYSQVFQCPRCLDKIPLFDCRKVEGFTAGGKPVELNVCPHCFDIGHEEVIRSQSQKFGSVPVLVSYKCISGCRPSRSERRHNDPDPKKREFFRRFDLAKISEIIAQEIPHWYPHGFDMTGFSRYQRDALWLYGVSEVADLFTKRNLRALASVKEAICSITILDDVRSSLMFAFSSILLKASRLMAHNNDGIGRIQKGTYYIPQLGHDVHVLEFMREAVGDLISGYKTMSLKSMEISISTSSVKHISIPSSSIDYIFTDPPYAASQQYGELNYVWEAWLCLDTNWHQEEIIVNDVRGKAEGDWAAMMRLGIAECHRVLKPGRWLSLCYHDTSEGTWSLIQDIMAEVGFLSDKSDSALFIESKTKTTNQHFADKVTKRDLVINFRKPRPGEIGSSTITGDEDATTFTEKVRIIIRDYLTTHPGETKDRIYDEVVSKMVRSGRMEAHNFDDLLTQVAEETVEVHGRGLQSNGLADARNTYEIHRWYLTDSESDVADAAESAKEDRAAAVLRPFIEVHMEAKPDLDGVHYSDLFEKFVYGVKDKPRRELVDWLPDYFFRTPSGGYRPPQSEEEEHAKATARAAGVNRRIKRYLAYIKQGVAIPERDQQSSATLAEWIRQCKLTGLYEEGKVLFEQGGLMLDAMSDEQQVEVEEDYGTCVRMLARAGGAPMAKRRKGVL